MESGIWDHISTEGTANSRKGAENQVAKSSFQKVNYFWQMVTSS